MDFVNSSCHKVYRHVHLFNFIWLDFFTLFPLLDWMLRWNSHFEHFMFSESIMVGHNKCEFIQRIDALEA